MSRQKEKTTKDPKHVSKSGHQSSKDRSPHSQLRPIAPSIPPTVAQQIPVVGVYAGSSAPSPMVQGNMLTVFRNGVLPNEPFSDDQLPEKQILCAWCQNFGMKRYTLNTSTESKAFCSEKCFAACRRAYFKRNKVCDWCKHVRHTKEYLDYGNGERRLQFCSMKCLNQYKMDIFCKETQAALPQAGQLSKGSSASATLPMSTSRIVPVTPNGNPQIITPESWCKSGEADKVLVNVGRNETNKTDISNNEQVQRTETVIHSSSLSHHSGGALTESPPSTVPPMLHEQPVLRPPIMTQGPPHTPHMVASSPQGGMTGHQTPINPRPPHSHPNLFRYPHPPRFSGPPYPQFQPSPIPGQPPPGVSHMNSSPFNLPPVTVFVPYPVPFPVPIPIPIPIPIPMNQTENNENCETEDRKTAKNQEKFARTSQDEHGKKFDSNVPGVINSETSSWLETLVKSCKKKVVKQPESFKSVISSQSTEVIEISDDDSSGNSNRLSDVEEKIDKPTMLEKSDNKLSDVKERNGKQTMLKNSDKIFSDVEKRNDNPSMPENSDNKLSDVEERNDKSTVLDNSDNCVSDFEKKKDKQTVLENSDNKISYVEERNDKLLSDVNRSRDIPYDERPWDHASTEEKQHLSEEQKTYNQSNVKPSRDKCEQSSSLLYSESSMPRKSNLGTLKLNPDGKTASDMEDFDISIAAGLKLDEMSEEVSSVKQNDVEDVTAGDGDDTEEREASKRVNCEHAYAASPVEELADEKIDLEKIATSINTQRIVNEHAYNAPSNALKAVNQRTATSAQKQLESKISTQKRVVTPISKSTESTPTSTQRVVGEHAYALRRSGRIAGDHTTGGVSAKGEKAASMHDLSSSEPAIKRRCLRSRSKNH
ncbi:uncharacterized protein LOC102810227 [Saccoglossus kowalevskii]|uniref:Sine oculis-binding protein homolog n=1 Tax=Saccoglossus kowalevskii TaxID=10224 RepID=A0ABM0LUZ6_SACKO|nr:PREDICTED: sine oculis-binding protein homolog [Saccoglossus kowalevskii]